MGLSIDPLTEIIQGIGWMAGFNYKIILLILTWGWGEVSYVLNREHRAIRKLRTVNARKPKAIFGDLGIGPDQKPPKGQKAQILNGAGSFLRGFRGVQFRRLSESIRNLRIARK